MDSIYLINNGLTCFDIYDRLLQLSRSKKKEDIHINRKDLVSLRKIRKNNTDKLSMNGIIETRQLRNSSEFRSLVKGNFNANHFTYRNQFKYYCLCDRVSIETALILLNKENKNEVGHLELIILPYIKYENSIKKENDLTVFKNSFGKNSVSNLKNYWNIESNIISFKKAIKIDWSLVDGLSFADLKAYKLTNLVDLIIRRKIQFGYNIHTFIICNTEMIKNLFKLFIKEKKYIPNAHMKIFNTHCFKLDFTRNGNILYFNELSTIYPSKLGSNNIKYTFEGQKYDLYFQYYSKRLLINKLNIIPKSRCFDSDKLIKIVNTIKTGKNKNSSTKSSKNNLNTIQDFENIFNKINKN